jgi:predicted nucleic acid-binding protein
MKLVIADTGALISLAHIRQIELIEMLFGELYIAEAVWKELNNYDNPDFDNKLLQTLGKSVVKIKSKNYLSMVMDFGESESVILYEELNADFLLIDDRKARVIAESLQVNCIGSVGVLIKAKQKGIISELKPSFEHWLRQGRYFSVTLLNEILQNQGETLIK